MTGMHPLEQQRRDDETTGEFRTRSAGWRGDERRTDGWTMGREIIGTILGVLAVAVPLATGLVMWGAHVEAKFSAHDAELIYLHREDDVQEKRQSSEASVIDQRLVRIEAKIDRLGERR